MENDITLARTDNGRTVFDLLKSEVVKKRFAESTGKNLAAFTSAVTEIVNGNNLLKQCDPYSILSSVICAATLNLQINPSFGEAYIVPFKGKATFQVGYHGFVQLALRSGLYKNLYAGEIHEGEIRGKNPLNGELIIGDKISDDIIGYVAHLELANGFVKTIFMSKAEMEEHAKTYSVAYSYDLRNGSKNSLWSNNFDKMAVKTVLKKLLRNWGVKSVEMQQALQFDSKVVRDNDISDNKNLSPENIDATPSDDLVDIENDENFERVV